MLYVIPAFVFRVCFFLSLFFQKNNWQKNCTKQRSEGQILFLGKNHQLHPTRQNDKKLIIPWANPGKKLNRKIEKWLQSERWRCGRRGHGDKKSKSAGSWNKHKSLTNDQHKWLTDDLCCHVYCAHLGTPWGIHAVSNRESGYPKRVMRTGAVLTIFFQGGRGNSEKLFENSLRPVWRIRTTDATNFSFAGLLVFLQY